MLKQIKSQKARRRQRRTMFPISIPEEPAPTNIVTAADLVKIKLVRTIVTTGVKNLLINGTQTASTSSQLLKWSAAKMSKTKMIQIKKEISLSLQAALELLKNCMLQLKSKIKMPMEPTRDRNRIIKTHNFWKVRIKNLPASLQSLVERDNKAIWALIQMLACFKINAKAWMVSKLMELHNSRKSKLLKILQIGTSMAESKPKRLLSRRINQVIKDFLR